MNSEIKNPCLKIEEKIKCNNFMSIGFFKQILKTIILKNEKKLQVICATKQQLYK